MCRRKPTQDKNWNPGALWMTHRQIKESENFFRATRLISVSSARGMAHQVSFSDFLRQIVDFLSPEDPSIRTSQVYGPSIQDGSLKSEDSIAQRQHDAVCSITTTLSLMCLLNVQQHNSQVFK